MFNVGILVPRGAPQPIVKNGTFDTDTGWAKGIGWSISGGMARLKRIAAAGPLTQTVRIPAAGIYTISFTQTADVYITASLGETVLTPVLNYEQGSKTRTATFSTSAPFSALLYFGVFAEEPWQTAATIDNVSIIKIS